MEYRLPVDTRKNIVRLYKSGFSIPELSDAFCCSRTTINRYIISSMGVREAKTPVKFNPRVKSELGEFIGVFAGDGNVDFDQSKYRYRIRITLSKNETVYYERLSHVSKNLFGKKPFLVTHNNRNCIDLILVGKPILKILQHYLDFDLKDKTHTIALKGDINNYSKVFLSNFIMGLTISDGGVYNRYYGKGYLERKIEFTNTSRKLAEQYYKIVNNVFGIDSHFYIHQPSVSGHSIAYRVAILSYSNILKFYNRIGMTEPNRMSVLESIVSSQHIYK